MATLRATVHQVSDPCGHTAQSPEPHTTHNSVRQLTSVLHYVSAPTITQCPQPRCNHLWHEQLYTPTPSHHTNRCITQHDRIPLLMSPYCMLVRKAGLAKCKLLEKVLRLITSAHPVWGCHHVGGNHHHHVPWLQRPM